MRLEGKAFRLGDDIDTDVIIPGRYLRTRDTSTLASHLLEPLGIEPGELRGRIIVAGRNFGCGSSREQAPMAVKAAGVPCVVAQSFARIFFRNAINIGLPVVECSGAGGINHGDELVVDIKKGQVENQSRDHTYRTTPYPELIMEILEAGGFLNYYRRKRDG